MPDRTYEGDPIDGTYQNITERSEKSIVPSDEAHDGQEGTSFETSNLTELQQDIIDVATVMPTAGYSEIHSACEERGIDTSYQYVMTTVKDHLPTKRKKTNKAADDGAKPWRNKERLRELYVEKELNEEEVGKLLGCSRTTVNNWLEKHGIEKRSRGFEELKDEDWLREKYHDEGLTLSEIADEVGASDHTPVLRAMEKHGIERRDSNYIKDGNRNRDYRSPKKDAVLELEEELEDPQTGEIHQILTEEKDMSISHEYVSMVRNGSV